MKLIFRLVSLVAVVCGVFLIYKNVEPVNKLINSLVGQKSAEDTSTHELIEKIENKKAALLAEFLVKYKKPRRIEVTNATQSFSIDAEEIKKLQLPLDPKSKIYITVNLFTDETDNQAPLIAQIQFMDIETDNKLSEQNINLE